MPLFVHQDGRVLLPTARSVWDRLLSHSPQPTSFIDDQTAGDAFTTSRASAEAEGQTLRDELLRLHEEHLGRERQKGEYAFAARKRTIQRIGLPEVRNHRLKELEDERREWQEQLAKQAETSFELVPLIMIHIQGGGTDD